jgi:hypothetical protein
VQDRIETMRRWAAGAPLTGPVSPSRRRPCPCRRGLTVGVDRPSPLGLMRRCACCWSGAGNPDLEVVLAVGQVVQDELAAARVQGPSSRRHSSRSVGRGRREGEGHAAVAGAALGSTGDLRGRRRP